VFCGSDDFEKSSPVANGVRDPLFQRSRLNPGEAELDVEFESAYRVIDEHLQEGPASLRKPAFHPLGETRFRSPILLR